MANRRHVWFYDLAMLPWWLNLGLGAGVFALIQYGAAEVETPGSAAAVASPFVAWSLLLAFVVAALLSAFQQRARRRLLEQQTDLDSVRALPWDDFQHLVGEAYRRLGYHVRETGADDRYGGVDLVLRKHGETTLVECKRWRLRKVRSATLRDLQGVMAAEKARYGLVVTTGEFTSEAKAFADERAIGLVDGPQLLKLLQSVRRSPLAPPRPRSAKDRRCPQCGRAMVLRTATKGPKAGVRFWGCTGFPACKGTRTVGAVIGRSHAKPDSSLQRA